MTISQSIIDRLLREQGNKCATCWRMIYTRDDYHVHHAVIPKGQTNYKKYKKYLDQAENLILVCWICHSDHGHLTNSFRRDIIWSRKIEQGYDMQGWYDSIPMLDKSHQFIYMESREDLDK